MPELIENAVIVTSDRQLVSVNLIDGSCISIDIAELADYIDTNRENIKFHKSSRRRQPLGFTED